MTYSKFAINNTYLKNKNMLIEFKFSNYQEFVFSAICNDDNDLLDNDTLYMFGAMTGVPNSNI